MSPKYRFKDASGIMFVGDTYQEVVRNMKKNSWMSGPKRNYMRDVRGRLKILGTTTVSVDSARSFILSLTKSGWLTRVGG